jgi:hypothetical protein
MAFAEACIHSRLDAAMIAGLQRREIYLESLKNRDLVG